MASDQNWSNTGAPSGEHSRGDTLTAPTLPSDQNASGRTLGDAEIAALAEAIASGTLTPTKGTFVKRLEQRFAERLGSKHAYACSSGTAAIHAAIAAVNPEPGDEIITTSVTDMGALTPIVFQGAIPVFADVDHVTLNVTAETIAARISERTRAVIVTHLFGNPCDMGPIMELAHARGITVIEDCAQAYLARSGPALVGTIGHIGCFSLQQGKHVTTGEGGLITCNDADLARRLRMFINKAWPYGESSPDHEFLALNYRMSELQGAVGLAQLGKLDNVARTRVANAQELNDLLDGIDGLALPRVHPGDVHTYWKYCLRVDETVIPGGSDALGAALAEQGIASAPRYIRKPAFQCRVFSEQNTFGTSNWPFNLARSEAIDYAPESYPGTFRGLAEVLVLPWNESYTREHVSFIADAVRNAVARLTNGGAA